ncbi:hypothetical protein [Metabacillus iocasae]|uniref:YqgU-like 6-bladed beta-propeller domain-containing protein n=1 Tax=Priestia iocasae TaxID=2291674 RepID=A0ABS2QQP2_9BACI|nr:hypothetical protein [Metabacillus iocasae]MBM7701538.1 hypothetical protein [Metabacillus iocasae]
MIKRVMVFIFVIVMLVACQSEASNDPNKAQKQHEGEKKVTNQQEIKPYIIEQSAFGGIGDWYDNHHVLIIKHEKKGSIIEKYNIYTGKTELFFRSDAPIISVKANPNYHTFLVHLSQSTEEATLLFLNQSGETLDTLKLESFDVQYTWNPFLPNQVFITSFLEDWTFNLFLRDVAKKTHQLYTLPQPFIHWINQDEIIYLDVDDVLANPYAPLVKFNLDTNEATVIKEDVVGVSYLGSTLITIEENDGVGTYTFWDSSFEKVDKLTLPIITEYDGPLIPYSQMDPSEQLFYTFKSNSSKQFDFIVYSLEHSKVETLIEGIENMPLKLSPDGKISLIGYQFEQVIKINEKTIMDLVKFQ